MESIESVEFTGFLVVVTPLLPAPAPVELIKCGVVVALMTLTFVTFVTFVIPEVSGETVERVESASNAFARKAENGISSVVVAP